MTARAAANNDAVAYDAFVKDKAYIDGQWVVSGQGTGE